jgi:hypothetical protein
MSKRVFHVKHFSVLRVLEPTTINWTRDVFHVKHIARMARTLSPNGFT